MSYAIVAAVAGVLALFALVAWGARRREAERAEEYRKEASMRGWMLETERRPMRYSGTTERIPWTFETVGRNQSRWETTAVRSDEVVLVWPHDAKVNLQEDVPEFGKQLIFKALARVFDMDAAVLANAKVEMLPDETAQFVGAVVTRDGMRLVVPVAAPTPSEVAKVVALGVKMARTRRQQGVL